MSQSPDLYRRYLVWGLSGPLIFFNFWVLGQLFAFFEEPITIVTIAAILALLLSYPVRTLERRRVKPAAAAILVLVVVVTVFLLLGFTVIPLVLDQANQLLNALPQWLDKTRQQILWLQELAQRHRININLEQLINQLERLAQTLVTWLPGLAIGTLGRLLDGVLIVVLSVYMLLYGPQMWWGLVDLLPAKFGQAFSKSIQFNVQQFFISQFLLALTMLLGLIPIFTLIRVNFPLLFALIVALFELIPFIGASIGIFIVTMLTLLQGFWTAFWVAILAIALQQVKDNVVAPRLLGKFIGLNPVWIFFSLLLGARIAGVLGVILAIPIAGTIKGTVEQLRASPVLPNPAVSSSRNDP
jgi:predicted PurR-regulated permease PerM